MVPGRFAEPYHCLEDLRRNGTVDGRSGAILGIVGLSQSNGDHLLAFFGLTGNLGMVALAVAWPFVGVISIRF